MRDRLIELIKEANKKSFEYIRENDNMDYIPTQDELCGVYADYLLANGVIVPPCKVGDRLYWINRVSEEVETDRVISLHLYETNFEITTLTVGKKSITTYSLNRLLEIMYFTKEEAEAALVNYESTKIEKGGKKR